MLKDFFPSDTRYKLEKNYLLAIGVIMHQKYSWQSLEYCNCVYRIGTSPGKQKKSPLQPEQEVWMLYTRRCCYCKRSCCKTIVVWRVRLFNKNLLAILRKNNAKQTGAFVIKVNYSEVQSVISVILVVTRVFHLFDAPALF